MVITVEYDNQCNITRVVKAHSKNISRSKRTDNFGVVTRMPRGVVHMPTNEIRSRCKVKHVNGLSVELEYGEG